MIEFLVEAEGVSAREACLALEVSEISEAKIADLTDNMNLARLGVTTTEDEDRAEKYRAARDFLQAL